jgi:hypothetical protein
MALWLILAVTLVVGYFVSDQLYRLVRLNVLISDQLARIANGIEIKVTTNAPQGLLDDLGIWARAEALDVLEKKRHLY